MKHEVTTLTEQAKLVHDHVGGIENDCEACEAGYALLAEDAEYEDQADRKKIRERKQDKRYDY